MSNTEIIDDNGAWIAVVIRGDAAASTTTFLTRDDDPFQAGFVVYPAGGRVEPHVHVAVTRTVIGTAEFLLVRSGRCIVDVYTSEQRLIASRELCQGDAVLSLGGGHGFRMLEDTVILEVKQGPYGGPHEKVRFVPADPENRA